MAYRIFVNYRRDDARADAARIRDRLAHVFGEANVFMDTENLTAGQRFDRALDQELKDCNMLIAVMGPRWLDILNERQEKGESDFVVTEIATAIERDIAVVPVLIDRARLPRPDELPQSIGKLALYQKHDVSHENFRRDFEALVGAIRAISKGALREKRGGAWISTLPGALLTLLAALAIAGGALYLGRDTLFSAPDAPGQDRASTERPQPEGGGKAHEMIEDAGAPKVARAAPESQPEPEPEASGGPQPGSVFRDCPDLCPEMVVLPQGTFRMGSDAGDLDERPVRTVAIAYPFAVSRHEISFSEWDACVADGGCRHVPEADWGRGRQPVMRVSWLDVTGEYLPWLSRKARATYRLLSEAEWEYAARAGTTGDALAGAPTGRPYAQFSDRKTLETGSLAANLAGLHDMSGNVWEWVLDCHNDSYSGVPADGGPASENPDCLRVIRGGSWKSPAGDLRPANRDWSEAANRSNTIGFRVARTLEATKSSGQHPPD